MNNDKYNNITASILDRLLDTDPEQNPESAVYHMVSKRHVLDSVVRDIENLLNTRCSPIVIPDTLNYLKSSLIRYGLKDFTVENPENALIRQKICMDMKKALSAFEPRLKKIIVRVESQSRIKRQLSFRIAGILMMDSLAEPVSFDTVFDINRGRYMISI